MIIDQPHRLHKSMDGERSVNVQSCVFNTFYKASDAIETEAAWESASRVSRVRSASASVLPD